MMQKVVHGETREAVDTLDYIWQVSLAIWESFPMELKAFVLMVFTISILMQWIKKALLADKTKHERVKLLWLSSLPLGLVLAGLGWYLSGDAIHVGYWVIIGLTVGATAMGVHFISTKFLWPALKVVVRAIWDRLLLLVRGR